MTDYSKMTNDDFDRILADLIDKTYPKSSQLLTIPGIYEILAEEFNNDVLTVWGAEQTSDSK